MLSLGLETTAGAVKTTTKNLPNVVLLNTQVISQWGTLESPREQNKVKQSGKKQRFSFTTAVPGNLFYPSDKVKGTLTALQPPAKLTAIPIAVTVLDAHGVPVIKRQALRLAKSDGYAVSLNLPPEPGYYRITLEAAGQRQEFNARYAVIPPNLQVGKNPASPFGVNTHFNQGWPPAVGQIVKRAGIAWIRDGQPSHKDRAVAVAKANNLCYLPVFTRYRAPLDKHKRADGTWDFSDVAEWHRQYAAKYGADIDYYDLVNEPHFGWMKKLGGSWKGGPWQKPFVSYGRQITKAIKAGDPGAIVLWEDIDQLIWYRQFYALGAAAGIIDGISPHPYHLHRDNPFPENHPMIRQMPKFQQFVHEKKLPWTVWSGEVGFSSFQGPNPRLGQAPHTELEQAQKLVRMMVGQLANGVEKVFWYDMRNDGWQKSNPEHNFGLMQNNNQPKPALVAYANLIHRVQDGKWLGQAQMEDAFAYAFVSRQTSQPVLVAWMKEGAKTVTVPLRHDSSEVAVTDIFGRKQKVSVEGSQLRLNLTSSPVYVEGLGDRAISRLLQSGHE